MVHLGNTHRHPPLFPSKSHVFFSFCVLCEYASPITSLSSTFLSTSYFPISIFQSSPSSRPLLSLRSRSHAPKTQGLQTSQPFKGPREGSGACGSKVVSAAETSRGSCMRTTGQASLALTLAYYLSLPLIQSGTLLWPLPSYVTEHAQRSQVSRHISVHTLRCLAVMIMKLETTSGSI
jgi:hypothetical protein